MLCLYRTTVYGVYYGVASSTEVIYPDYDSTFIEAIQTANTFTSASGIEILLLEVVPTEVTLRASFFSLKAEIYVAYEDVSSFTSAIESAWLDEFGGM